ncbi:cytochrome c oxidase assembly protein subunit 11 [Crenobacter luteus]|uniref:Cytochrome c oxidase assembly protein CtaG n=1 Tax=Crenobacter luteus TaxID=1452487 RepID=A0A163CVT0_9NEIS|nr:cytochrome c oxidase assembly protein [Crenobacter luteus]KZE33291.1 cytochrome C oxidase assembly protein [Crenobacter luteus]TCP13618.1 cytochrome c oxidase assembly protein subunit 11 [Crenobacter luteus]
MRADTRRSANLALLKKLALIALLMFGFAWGLIPIYRVICEVTGINQLQRADAVGKAARGAAAAEVLLTFDATVQAGLPWQVRPLTGQLRARPGEFVKVEYEIVNAGAREVVGQAIPRYLPAAAGEYVKKLDCFCFKQQAFAPGERRRFPVVFFVDPALPEAVREITLSYTVFDVPGKGA